MGDKKMKLNKIILFGSLILLTGSVCFGAGRRSETTNREKVEEPVSEQGENSAQIFKQDKNEELVKYVYADDMDIYIEQKAYSFISKNPALKQTLTKWINYNTNHRASRTNYTKIYELLSERYLKERYPEVTNAQEYKEIASKYNEIYFYYFLAFEKLKKINKNRIEIIFTAWYSYEGITYKVSAGDYFLKTNNTWKYDGAPEEYPYTKEKLDIHFNP
ncbi:MAG: hypothetical protein ACQEQC_05890 [Elusimicrobiota bacterium]